MVQILVVLAHSTDPGHNSDTAFPSGDTDNQFDQLTLDIVISDISPSSTDRDEAYTYVQLKQNTERYIINLRAKIDTGAQTNTIPIRMYRRMYPMTLDSNGFPCKGQLSPSSSCLRAYNGTQIKQYGMLQLPCKYGKSEWHTALFHICETDGPAIIGLRTVLRLNIVARNCSVESDTSPVETQRCQPIASVQDLKTKYPEQFDAIGNFSGAYYIVLRYDVQPVIHAPRKCPIHIRDELKAELTQMEAQGVSRKVTEPTDWVSSIAVSCKANGQLRICLDPTDLNKSIRRCYHKTPTVEEITHKLAGAKVFSKLDAKHGYWSVHLDKASSLLTTFNSPFGRFCYKRMPFGLNVRQDVFQHRMDQILEQCDGVIGIADDIIVFGDSEQSHDRNLHRLMTVAATTGFKFNSSKCTIKDPHVLFFGMIYDVNGVHPDPSKVKAIKAMPSPTDPIKLREFLGMVTYLSPFIPNLSSHTADLRVLLQKDIDYVWSPSHQQCFEKVRDQIYELQPCDILTPTNPLKYKWMHPYADWVLRSCKMAPRWRMLQRHLAMLRLDTPTLNVKCSQLFSAAKGIIPTFTVNISQLRVIISHYK